MVPLTKGSAMRKAFPCHDIIMEGGYEQYYFITAQDLKQVGTKSEAVDDLVFTQPW